MSKPITKNFPFLQEDLLTTNSFISYCKDRGVRIDKELLEELHKSGIIYPCVRLNPGIDGIFIKIKAIFNENLETRFIYIDDFKKFAKAKRVDKKKYYRHGSISGSGEKWLDPYVKDNLIEYPVDDKRFSPWDKYKLAEIDFITSTTQLKNHRVLMYSKQQIYMLKHILDCRPFKMIFDASPSSKLLENLFTLIKDHIEYFDKLFKDERYLDYIKFFEALNLIQKFYDKFDKAVHVEASKSVEIKNKESLKEWIREYKGVRGGFIKHGIFRKKANAMVKNHNIDLEWLSEWRERIFT